MKQLMTCALVVMMMFPAIAVGHEGLIDSRGCHTDNDGTNYHCHPERLKEEKSAAVKLVDEEDGENGAEKPEARPRNQRQNNINLFPPASPKNHYSSKTSNYSNNTSNAFGGFNHAKADSAMTWTSTLISITSLAGGFIAMSAASENEFADPLFAFSTTALSGLLSGVAASSLYSMQVGLDASSQPLGLLMVVLSALAPLAIGLAY